MTVTRKTLIFRSPLENFHAGMRRQGLSELARPHAPRYIDLEDDRVRILCRCGWRGPSVHAPAHPTNGRDIEALRLAHLEHVIEQATPK